MVFDFKFLIYDKQNIGYGHLFFSNHLKSTKIKQSSFGKHQKLNTPKLNIHIFTENRQNIPTQKYPNLPCLLFYPNVHTVYYRKIDTPEIKNRTVSLVFINVRVT